MTINQWWRDVERGVNVDLGRNRWQVVGQKLLMNSLQLFPHVLFISSLVMRTGACCVWIYSRRKKVLWCWRHKTCLGCGSSGLVLLNVECLMLMFLS